MLKVYKPETCGSVKDYSFKILDKVALSGSWSIVYDIKNRKIYFKTESNQTIREVDFKTFTFGCETESMIYDLGLQNEGNVSGKFIKYDAILNKQKMKEAMKLTGIELPGSIMSRFYKYASEGRCDTR